MYLVVMVQVLNTH